MINNMTKLNIINVMFNVSFVSTTQMVKDDIDI